MRPGPSGGAAPLAAGAKVGTYEVLGHLATGGMGEVYLARKTGIGGFEHLVVLKIMLAHLARDERFSQMFIDEARIVSRLSHPNIVHVFDLDRANGTLYLAMEHLDGQSVATCLKLVATRNTDIPIEVAARILADASNGLSHAHAARDTAGISLGVVHRDVSPENLFVTYAGPTKILDFGVAKVRGKMAQTQDGEFKGKVAYMAPEVIRGRPADSRADLFALGVVMFEMLTTRRLFNAPNPATTLHRVLAEPVPDLRALRREVDAELAALCMALLERDPDRRVQTADNVAEQLELWLARRAVSNKVVGQWLVASFADAHALSAQIQETVARTGRIDPEDLRRARKLGGADLDEGAIRDLSSEERAFFARGRGESQGRARALAEIGSNMTPVSTSAGWSERDQDEGRDPDADQDSGWILRAHLGRWALGFLLIAAFVFGVRSLMKETLDPTHAHLPASGDTIAGRYVVEGTVFESPRSSIYRARDLAAANAAAMVWTSARAPHEAEALVRSAKDAAERIRRAQHPSLPDVHDVGKSGDRVFTVMEWYDGRTLAEMLEREVIPSKRARKIAVELAGAMAAAEREGLVHGALDPTSILVDRDDSVMIVGFVMGFVPLSPAASEYIAPEVRPGVTAGSRVDQYAIAQVTKEMLRVWDHEGAVKAAAVIARATLLSEADRWESVDRLERELETALGVKKSKRQRR